MTFLSIANPVEDELIKEKNSKFLGFVYPVSNETEIHQKLEDIARLHPKATHICYAYRLGASGEVWRANDNGEPTNSAGMPILGQLQSFNVSNVLCAIVRYYGGTKLGVGGLKQAYKMCALQSLQKAETISVRLMNQAEITCPLAKIDAVLQLIGKFEGNQTNMEVGWEAKIQFEMPQEKISAFEENINSVFRLKLTRN